MFSSFLFLLVCFFWCLRCRRITASPVLSPRSCRGFASRPSFSHRIRQVWRIRKCRPARDALSADVAMSFALSPLARFLSPSISPAFDAGSSFPSISRSIGKGAASLPLPLCIRLCMADFLIGTPTNFNLWGERKRPCNYR